MKKKRGEHFRPGWAYLSCKIGPTRFEDERVVYIEGLDGGTTVAIVDPQEVKPSDPIDQTIQGEAIVTVISRIPRAFLIDPPGQAVTGGRTFVPEAAVKFP